MQIGSSQGAVLISGRVSATGATGNGGTISVTGEQYYASSAHWSTPPARAGAAQTYQQR